MAAPNLERMEPSKLRQGERGLIVNLYGSDFDPEARVEFSTDVEIERVEVVSDTHVRVHVHVPETRAAPETGTVSVSNPDNQVSPPLAYRITEQEA